MNKKHTYILKNIWYSLSANFITLAISIILTLFVPKLIGIEEYGYYQLYLFYGTFIGFLHFGIIDGIYLTIGGKEYEELDKQSIGSQYWYIIFLNIILSVFVVLITLKIENNDMKRFVIFATCISSITTNGKTLLLFVLQGTNKIKEYAMFTRLDRFLYFFFVIGYLLLGGKSSVYIIIFDLIAKIIVLVMMTYKYRDLAVRKITSLSLEIKNIMSNMKIGINLTLSYIASQFIIGSIRLGIENKWDIVTFGKVSLTLSLSNMVMTFINAISAIMFPLLRKSEEKDLNKIYINLRNIFLPFLFFILILFEPIKLILLYWLPAYRESIYYMGILFPIFIYESKVLLLTNTYLKSLRKEKMILKINFITLLLSILGVYIVVNIFENLIGSIFLILFCLIFRANYSEIYLSKLLGLEKKDYLFNMNIELLLTAIFVLSTIKLSTIYSFGIYLTSYIIYIIIKKSEIKKSINETLIFFKK